MWCDRYSESMDLGKKHKHFMKILEISMGPTNLWLKEPQLAMTFLGIILLCQSVDLPWDDLEKVAILGGFSQI
jgi:hypothetical protein